MSGRNRTEELTERLQGPSQRVHLDGQGSTLIDVIQGGRFPMGA